MYQVIQTLQKLKLFNKFKIIIKKIQIQLIIMIVDIDKKNNNYQLLNILQLKWILQKVILKKNYKIILKIKSKLIIKKLINH